MNIQSFASSRWNKEILFFLGLAGLILVLLSYCPPTAVVHNVPFTCQAPSGNWEDPAQADGCEEACVLMVSAALGIAPGLDSTFVIAEIHKMAEYENLVFGSFADMGLDDTVRLLRWYLAQGLDPYAASPAPIKVGADGVSAESMKTLLGRGYVLLAPINGQKLKHPNYRPPGPLAHMVLVIGYDDEQGAFVINDPGTKHGQGMNIFSYERFVEAMGDYRSGAHINTPNDERQKAFVAVRVKR